MKREQIIIISLLGIGALILLAYLMRKRGTGAATTVNEAGSPSYPNGQPIKPTDIQVGSSPLYLTYNTGPDVPVTHLGDNVDCGCDTLCCGAGTLVTSQNIPKDLYASASANFSGYLKKAA